MNIKRAVVQKGQQAKRISIFFVSPGNPFTNRIIAAALAEEAVGSEQHSMDWCGKKVDAYECPPKLIRSLHALKSEPDMQYLSFSVFVRHGRGRLAVAPSFLFVKKVSRKDAKVKF